MCCSETTLYRYSSFLYRYEINCEQSSETAFNWYRGIADILVN